MLVKIAWRNVWRSRTRSVVVILSIAVGVWALSFVLSFSNGITYTYIKNAIREQYSHLQLHHPVFEEDKNSKYLLDNASGLLASLRQMPEVEAVTSRSITLGMASTSRGARGVQIIGIDPASEAAVTGFDQHLTEGDYFLEDKRNPILVSERMAEKLKVKVRSKIVLTFQNLEGEITRASFRVVGLFNTGNMIMDEALVYVQADDLKNLLLPEPEKLALADTATAQLPSLPTTNRDVTNEVAIYLKDPAQVGQVKAQLRRMYPDTTTHLVEDYWELSPDIELYETQIKTSNTIVIIIFMLALIFGIINTMLMAVLERYKELGMLMAIGLNKQKIFTMILLETLFLAAVAAPIGIAIGYLTVYSLQDTGIDLSSFARGLERFGMETTIYPVLDLSMYATLAGAVFITALLAALYPGWKAVKLRPVEALQKI